jgi:hypothetical protein
MHNPVELKDWQEKNGFTKPKEKVKIYYDPVVYAQTIKLVKEHPVEIGWNMVILPYQDGYKVWDILIYPQKVSAAYISVDLPRYGMWKASLDYKTEAAINGHGHSHVNMSPFASIVDVNQQHDEILTKHEGFYLFQIWNKHNEINSFFYDLDNKIYYTKDDIEIIVEDVDNFVEESFRMVTGEKRTFPMEVGEDF